MPNKNAGPTKSNGRIKHAKALGYSRDLINPIVKQNRKSGVFDSREEASDATTKGEFLRKCDLLAQHYGIAENEFDSRMLLLRVLLDWVPGFEIVDTPKRKSGAPIKNDTPSVRHMVKSIDAILSANPQLTKIAACGQFQKRPGQEPRWKTVSPRTIVNLYSAKKSSVDRTDALICALIEERSPPFQAAANPTNESQARGGLFSLGQGLISSQPRAPEKG